MGFKGTKSVGRPAVTGIGFEPGFTYIEAELKKFRTSGSGGRIIGTSQFDRGVVELKGFDIGYDYPEDSVQVLVKKHVWRNASTDWTSASDVQLELELGLPTNSEYKRGSTNITRTSDVMSESATCDPLDQQIGVVRLDPLLLTNNATDNAYDLEVSLHADGLNYPTSYTLCLNEGISEIVLKVPSDSINAIRNNDPNFSPTILYQG